MSDFISLQPLYNEIEASSDLIPGLASDTNQDDWYNKIEASSDLIPGLASDTNQDDW